LAEQRESWALDKIIEHIPFKERKLFWRDINRIANFLKHADQDQNELLTDVDPTINDHFILYGCMLSADLSYLSRPMIFFQTFYVATYPDNFELNSASIPVREFVSSCKDATRSQLISKLREVMSKNEDGPRGADAKFH
jgi:hypothetical protein